MYSGFAWAGFNLCIGLFIWDAAPQDNRIRFIALFGALNALGITLGSLIGGNLGPHLPEISGSYFLTLFLLAGVIKLLVVLGLFRRISEVRNCAVGKNFRATLWRSKVDDSKMAAKDSNLTNATVSPRTK